MIHTNDRTGHTAHQTDDHVGMQLMQQLCISTAKDQIVLRIVWITSTLFTPMNRATYPLKIISALHQSTLHPNIT